jgi:hypothetical protein
MKNIFLSVLGLFALVMILVYLECFLWNVYLVSAIDGINEVGFIQMLGIDVLFGLLFGSGFYRIMKNQGNRKNLQ